MGDLARRPVDPTAPDEMADKGATGQSEIPCDSAVILETFPQLLHLQIKIRKE